MEENNSSTEDVKQTFEVSKEQFEKLKELEANKTIALKKEREEADKLKLELEEHKKFKLELEEKEKLKKGKYEEVIAEKDKLLTELQEKANLYDKILETQNNKIKTELEGLISSIPSDILEEHNIFLEDLSDEKKIAYLKKISEVKKESFNNKTEGEGNKIDTKTEYEKAKEKGDIKAMLKLAGK